MTGGRPLEAGFGWRPSPAEAQAIVKAHPILFSGPMVRAILAGRKTQTRRVIRPGHPGGVITGPAAHEGMTIEAWGGGQWNVASRMEAKACPYGVPGDRLWVRETWRNGSDTEIPTQLSNPGGSIYYRADEEWNEDAGWRPSIFMPRHACRIHLEVTAVRVERLQAISNDDARAEGMQPDCRVEHLTHELACYREAFERGWDSINGKRAPWASNPWVWVITFKVVA